MNEYHNLFNYLQEKWDDIIIELGDVEDDKCRQAIYRERKALFRIMYHFNMIERLCENDEEECEFVYEELMDHYLNEKNAFE